MPIEIDGRVYYHTAETCSKAGISRATLFRWLKAGILERHYRDRRGWRVFTEDDVNWIRAEAGRIEVEPPVSAGDAKPAEAGGNRLSRSPAHRQPVTVRSSSPVSELSR